MALIKCKMCGGDLILTEGQSVAECEYCGSWQTVPAADNEKKLTLFARANRLRAACEFDKAAGIYESIVADFPEEAEAYWGLVLCKYGIEYVDDPATGKKVPTCHRSSFESVMEDSDLEQALENADGKARKVYREEAKAIEELRKGIIAVSANEEPYDIFICYKETDEKGERTLDSVLAQDVYDALTDKGYRVFFSRITLEDKLGMEYEPYIFAALNSAKIMLAFGTDYEYFNAVWVKNEWSRYLKLMAKDKSKHLIPCFKGIDAYDMPKEFARLQAQDLGKVGAVQDLMRGIEKLLPRQQNTVTIVQEQVVVGGGGNNKIASLLDRGNMALEDGDWAKADSFFEDVLNNDSKNAQAYLGKTLAQERCRTIDAFVRKRKDASQNVRGETLKLQPDRAHVDQMVNKCAIYGYVEQHAIRILYDFDLSYHSDVAERQQQYQTEEKYWAEHKLLSRAEKFAVGPVAENLKREKQALFAALSDRVKKAEEAAATAKKDVQTRYEAHLRQADAQAEKLYQEGFARRDHVYQELLKTAKASSSVFELTNTAKKFDELGAYQDSRNQAEHCRRRADEELAKIDAERELAKQMAQKRKLRNKKIAAMVFAAVLAISALTYFVIIPNVNYNKAVALMNERKYPEAIVAFEALGDYKDSADQANACRYSYAVSLAENEGKYPEAIVAFESLGDYKDSVDLLQDCVSSLLEKGEQELARGELEKAAITFGQIGDHQDARQRSLALWKQSGKVVSLDAEFNHSVGLKADGTVVAVGDNDDGQCNVSEWNDIVAISAGAYHTVGLKADGTVVAVGDNDDGQCNVSEWNDIVAISAGAYHTVGLKADGTVVAVGPNDYGQCDVSEWNDIVAISTGSFHTVGLNADGTVVAVGWNEYGQCDVSEWTDIIAISAGTYHTVGLRADGTVVAVGRHALDQCDVSEWNDIVAISAGDNHTVGLKADGTVVAVGYNAYGQCNVSDWTNIMIP